MNIRMVEVALLGRIYKQQDIFTYSVPDDFGVEVQPGVWVQVPLGRALVQGCVLAENSSFTGNNIRPIKQVLSSGPVFSHQQLNLALWTSRYFMCPVSQILNIMSRHAPLRKLRLLRLQLSDDNQLSVLIQYWSSTQPSVGRLLEYLKFTGAISRQLLARKFPGVQYEVEQLVLQGIVSEELAYVVPQPLLTAANQAPAALHLSLSQMPVLNGEQQQALLVMENCLTQEKPTPVLLQGITGSGKTELYMRLIEHTIRRQKTALILAPEIVLAEYLFKTIAERFGARAAILHSKLSKNKLKVTHEKLAAGDIDILIGARSAVFAPLPRLGLVVLDEEHSASYKQDVSPRYHCREVAQKKADLNSALLVLGSATPSLETWWKAQQGEFRHVRLTARVECRPLPKVQFVDLREELRTGYGNILSRKLNDKLKHALDKQQQAILFVNRRGFASIVTCKYCGEVIRCRYCSMPLTYHRSKEVLQCHWCGWRSRKPQVCPQCSETGLLYRGYGTERVVSELSERFPQSKILRIDTDAVEDSDADQWSSTILEEDFDILVGTQMIAKGLNLPRVTLVGILNADIGLQQPDFRAAENTFQTTTQVIGRAGRGNLEGDVVIQSYHPGHYALLAAAHHRTDDFYQAEIHFRKEHGYPPFLEIVRLVFSGPSDDRVRAGSEVFERYVKMNAEIHSLEDDSQTSILGPAPAPLHLLRGNYRWQLILTSSSLEKIRSILDRTFPIYAKQKITGVQIAVDVQPMNML